MFIIVWRYSVPEDRRDEFRSAYGSEGAWARLFRRSSAYLGTRLLEDCERPGRFLTLDMWADEASREQFISEMREEYELLDRETAHLTSLDEQLGSMILPAPSLVW